MKRFNIRHLLAVSLLVTAVGCTPVANKPITGVSPNQDSNLVANNTAGFVGHVLVPSELISNNAGGLVSNTSGSLVSNNAGSYRTQAVDEIPLANSLVYFLNLNDQFYTDTSGNHLVTTTDASGDYKIAKALQPNKPVIVAAMLAGNRRMVGYTVTKDGQNQVNVSVATTYVTEFFRAEAAHGGDATKKTMADYPDALTKLPAIADETQKLIDAGKLSSTPDMTVGNAQALNKQYFASFSSQSQRLSDLWADLLGRRIIGVSTVAGNYTLGTTEEPAASATSIGLSNPVGVAFDPAGNMYVAIQSSHIIRKVAPDGSTSVIGNFKGDGSVTDPVPSGDGVDVANFSIPQPQDVSCDALGNLIVTSNKSTALYFVCQHGGTYYNRPMTAGKVYVIGDASVALDAAATDSFKDAGVSNSRFRSPYGVCFDDHGNIYVADRRNNLIRCVDRATGNVKTIAGRLTSDLLSGDQLDTWNGLNPNTSPDGSHLALGAVINRPFDVAWRRNAQGKNELFVWEGANPTGTVAVQRNAGNAIRRITFDDNAATTGTIETIAGGPTLRGFSGDGGAASTAQIKLVDPATSPDVPNGGMALSPDGRYLYFCDALNFRIRVIDLNTLNIATAAGGGTEEGDAEAGLANFKNVSGLAVDAQGSVYFCDAFNNVVRKINYQFGR